jgi:N-acetylglucosamine-6-phosphate deacetylase
MTVFKNAMIDNTVTDITVEDGIIVSLERSSLPGVDLGGMRVYPGLIDVHVHGCIGYDVSDKDDNLGEMADYLLAHGTTAWCPTTMTVSTEDIIGATHKNTELSHGAEIIGFHLEGPFINPKHKGAQNPDHIFRPTLSLLEKCKNVARITLAPELPGSKAFIENASCQVSLGHSDADYDTAKGAFRAGVSSLTHTFNAMNGIHHRAPGPILAAVETPGVYTELIADGKHIHPAVMRMIQMVVDAGHKENCPVCICGELAADTTLTERFLKMGVDALSVVPAYVLPVRKAIRKADLSEKKDK